MKLKLLVYCILLGICSLASSATASETKDSVTSVTIGAAQQHLQISLPANPTTGYQWTVTSYDKSLFHLDTSHFVAPTTKLIGAGGKMIFNFTILKRESYPKTTTLCFKYARPWERQGGNFKKIIVYFK